MSVTIMVSGELKIKAVFVWDLDWVFRFVLPDSLGNPKPSVFWTPILV